MDLIKVVIYARYSSHAQTEQSIEGQLKFCYEFARRFPRSHAAALRFFQSTGKFFGAAALIR